MSTLSRILIILLTAGIVVGAAWAITRNDGNDQSASMEAQFNPDGDDFIASHRPEGLIDSGIVTRNHGSFFSLSWIRIVLVHAIIITIVVVFERLLNKKRASRVLAGSNNDI